MTKTWKSEKLAVKKFILHKCAKKFVLNRGAFSNTQRYTYRRVQCHMAQSFWMEGVYIWALGGWEGAEGGGSKCRCGDWVEHNCFSCSSFSIFIYIIYIYFICILFVLKEEKKITQCHKVCAFSWLDKTQQSERKQHNSNEIERPEATMNVTLSNTLTRTKPLVYRIDQLAGMRLSHIGFFLVKMLTAATQN